MPKSAENLPTLSNKSSISASFWQHFGSRGCIFYHRFKKVGSGFKKVSDGFRKVRGGFKKVSAGFRKVWLDSKKFRVDSEKFGWKSASPKHAKTLQVTKKKTRLKIVPETLRAEPRLWPRVPRNIGFLSHL